MAPQEGAFAWLDGLSLPVGATNFDEAYEFLNYIYDSEVNGLIANETGYNPVSTGAENYLAPDAKRSEEHPSELQSLMRHSYAALCLQKKTLNVRTAHSTT